MTAASSSLSLNLLSPPLFFFVIRSMCCDINCDIFSPSYEERRYHLQIIFPTSQFNLKVKSPDFTRRIESLLNSCEKPCRGSRQQILISGVETNLRLNRVVDLREISQIESKTVRWCSPSSYGSQRPLLYHLLRLCVYSHCLLVTYTQQSGYQPVATWQSSCLRLWIRKNFI